MHNAKILGAIAVIVAIPSMALVVASCRSTASPHEAVDHYLRTKIEDRGRSERLLALSDRLNRELDALRADREEAERALHELHLDYDATREDFAPVLARAREKREAHRAQILGIVTEMREHTTPAEWTGLADLEIALIQ